MGSESLGLANSSIAGRKEEKRKDAKKRINSDIRSATNKNKRCERDIVWYEAQRRERYHKAKILLDHIIGNQNKKDDKRDSGRDGKDGIKERRDMHIEETERTTTKK